MSYDLQEVFSADQAVTASAASQNYMDLQKARNVGIGEGTWVECVVKTAMTDAGSNSTCTVTLESDDNASFSSATTIQTLGTFAALSAAGTRLLAKLQPMTTPERYLRGYFTVANGNLTTGAFDLHFIHGPHTADKYGFGYSFS